MTPATTKLLIRRNGIETPYHGVCTSALPRYIEEGVDEIETILITSELTEDIRTRYMDFLEGVGFKVKPVPMWKPGMNVDEWFATHTVVRYMWESDNAIRWWDSKVKEHPELDPWALFVLMHRYTLAYNYNNATEVVQRLFFGEGHTLIASWNNKIPDAQSILAKYRESPSQTFDWSKRGALQSVWSPTGSYRPGVTRKLSNYLVDYEHLVKGTLDKTPTT
jgi:hypothetical protein